jgi:NADP-dependent 3-hydroxy acid dehydrogenase YdfG
MADEPKVMLITGGSTGIGEATARRAAEAGWLLALSARSEAKLEPLAGDLGGPERAIAIGCDVSDWGQVESMRDAALAAFGRIDAVFANAGTGARRGFTEETPEYWREMVLTNILGVAYTIRATLPHMLERGTGHYLLTSSVAGRRSLPGSLYSATKFAVTGIGESLRQELRTMHDENGIKTTLIEPGMVDTPFFDQRPEGALEADDIARAVIYAVSQPAHVDVNEVLVRPIRQAM